MARRSIEVTRVLGSPTEEPRLREPKARDATLLFAKTLLLLACVLASVAAVRLRDARGFALVTNEWQGHALRYPRGWWVKKEGFHLATVVSERRSDHMQLAPRLLPCPEGVQVRLERFDLDEPEARERLSRQGLPVSVPDEVTLARLAALHVGIDPDHGPRLRRTTLMGRPAVEISGPRRGGWAAAVAMCNGCSLVLMQVAAPSGFDFDRASPTWRAMVRSARQVPVRSYKALGEPAADPRDPGWGSSEEGSR